MVKLDSASDDRFVHTTVMAAEVRDAFDCCPAGVLLDATVGGGGHSALLMEAWPTMTVVGIDQDAAALSASGARLARFGQRVTLHRAQFRHLGAVLKNEEVDSLAAFLFDLGVSSPQLDTPERGFSYREAGPLDMRMDSRQDLTASDVVNGYSEERLARIFAENADERYSRRIARAVVSARPVADTLVLAELVRSAIPAPARRRGGHPAKRAFQAIRIEVNDELGQLAEALDEAIKWLKPGGRGVVLSYHSGEDRIVKDRFQRASNGGCDCPPRLPCGCGAKPIATLPRRSAQKPRESEIKANPRASSARLRVLERA